jgi:hypothetical protein
MDAAIYNEVTEAEVRVRHREEPGQLTTWLDDRNRPDLTPVSLLICALCRINQVTQLLCETRLATFRGSGSYLHGNRVKVAVVTASAFT